MEFTLSLALLDFVPVFLTAFGFIYLIRLTFSVLPAQGRIAFIGGVLVVAGGLFKATWKSIMSLSHGAVDIHWMENSLFVLMTPGYILFAWSMWQVARAVQGKRTFHVWLLPTLVSLGVLGVSFYLYTSVPDSQAWKLVLLTITVVGNFVSGILLIVFAFRQKLTLAGWLFLLNLVCVFALNGLARASQTVLIHWIAEIVNTFSCLGFMLAAKFLYEYARAHFGVDAAVAARLAST
ncbi:MAG: hypothetical protein QM730_05615 [Anaerolineales bacterium]